MSPSYCTNIATKSKTHFKHTQLNFPVSVVVIVFGFNCSGAGHLRLTS